MSKLIDMTGKRFGKLIVIKRSKSRYNKTYWLCRCDCGNKKIIYGYSLSSGSTKSCGCLQKEKARKICISRSTHNMTNSSEYSTWSSMKKRCYIKKHKAYKDYGGRGIKVCDRWSKFENFYEDMGDRPVNKSLDRIDNDGDYSPENCRWATRREQMNNIRSNNVITYNGETKTLSQWARHLNIKRSTLKNRIVIHKWKIERAMTEAI